MLKKCLICKKNFKISPSHANKRSHCSIKCKASSQLGKPTWNKGLLGFGAKEKNPNWKGGKPDCQMCGEKVSSRKYSFCRKCTDIKKRGNGSFAWRGGITPENKIKRRWFSRHFSRLVFKRDGFRCVVCGRRNTYLHADHLEKWCDSIEKRFAIDNCRTICRPCHFFITFGKEMPPNSLWGIK